MEDLLDTVDDLMEKHKKADQETAAKLEAQKASKEKRIAGAAVGVRRAGQHATQGALPGTGKKPFTRSARVSERRSGAFSSGSFSQSGLFKEYEKYGVEQPYISIRITKSQIFNNKGKEPKDGGIAAPLLQQEEEDRDIEAGHPQQVAVRVPGMDDKPPPKRQSVTFPTLDVSAATNAGAFVPVPGPPAPAPAAASLSPDQ